MDGRDRVSRGSSERQTAQSHLIMARRATPVPRNTTRTIRMPACWRQGQSGSRGRRRAGVRTSESAKGRRVQKPKRPKVESAKEPAARGERAGRAFAQPSASWPRCARRVGVRDREQTRVLRPFLLEITKRSTRSTGTICRHSRRAGRRAVPVFFTHRLQPKRGVRHHRRCRRHQQKLIRRHPHVFTPMDGCRAGEPSARRTPGAVIEQEVIMRASRRKLARCVLSGVCVRFRPAARIRNGHACRRCRLGFDEARRSRRQWTRRSATRSALAEKARAADGRPVRHAREPCSPPGLAGVRARQADKFTAPKDDFERRGAFSTRVPPRLSTRPGRASRRIPRRLHS